MSVAVLTREECRATHFRNVNSVNIFVYIFLTGPMLTEVGAARVIFSSLPDRNGSSVLL